MLQRNGDRLEAIAQRQAKYLTLFTEKGDISRQHPIESQAIQEPLREERSIAKPGQPPPIHHKAWVEKCEQRATAICETEPNSLEEYADRAP